MSSILEFYLRHKREIVRYGIALLLMGSALVTGRMAAAVIVFGGALTMAAFDIWLRPYQIRGEFVFKQREVVHREEIKATVAALLARFGGKEKEEATVPKPEGRQETTSLLEVAGLPPVESPPPLPLETPSGTDKKPSPPVTHST